jgi:hypothetical protein
MTGAAFSCGVEALDAYLHRQAGQDLKKRAAVPFVVTPDGKTIAGYYTLSQYAVQLEAIPPEVAKRLPKYPLVPATLLGRLAVNTAFRGQGLGAVPLMDALYRTMLHSREMASAGVVVVAKDADALASTRSMGFSNFQGLSGGSFSRWARWNNCFDDKTALHSSKNRRRSVFWESGGRDGIRIHGLLIAKRGENNVRLVPPVVRIQLRRPAIHPGGCNVVVFVGITVLSFA